MPVERSGKIGFFTRQYSQSDGNLLYSRSGVLGVFHAHSAPGGSKETRHRIDGERQNHGIEPKRQDPVQQYQPPHFARCNIHI
jgi:hypothetical protein